MTEQEIINKVNSLLVEEFEIAEDLLTPEASLKQDLEIDSLDFVDIVVLIDREFGGMTNYLHEILCLTHEDIQLLRRRYLTQA